MNGLDQIGASICRLQHATGAEIDLHFVAVHQPGLDHASSRADVPPVHIVPTRDLHFGNGLQTRQDSFKIKRVAPTPNASSTEAATRFRS